MVRAFPPNPDSLDCACVWPKLAMSQLTMPIFRHAMHACPTVLRTLHHGLDNEGRRSTCSAKTNMAKLGLGQPGAERAPTSRPVTSMEVRRSSGGFRLATRARNALISWPGAVLFMRQLHAPGPDLVTRARLNVLTVRHEPDRPFRFFLILGRRA